MSNPIVNPTINPHKVENDTVPHSAKQEPKNLLILDNRYSRDSADLWRFAVRNGWSTERVHEQISNNIYDNEGKRKPWGKICYYGNLLHLDLIKDQLPIIFEIIDPTILPQLTEFTGRNIRLVKYQNLNVIDKPYFIKPVNIKWFEAKVYQPGESISGTPMFNDLIYIQDIVDFESEIRCFVLNGKIETASYYILNKVVWDLTNLDPAYINCDTFVYATNIPNMVKQIYDRYNLPKGLVMDFGLTKDGWKLIEFNEPHASGLYYCNWQKCFEVITGCQTNTF